MTVKCHGTSTRLVIIIFTSYSVDYVWGQPSGAMFEPLLWNDDGVTWTQVKRLPA